MDYAIAHPKNVVSLISIGTPYNGSWYDNWFVDFAIDDFDSIGGMDIVNPDMIASLKSTWNNVYSQNPHINFHAISATTSLSFMSKIFWQSDYIRAHVSNDPEEEALECWIRAAYVASVVISPFLPGLLSGDLCVDESSQRAEGYNGAKLYNKEFTASNCDFDKRARNFFPVPHNLEPYDPDIHEYILNNIRTGVGRTFYTTALPGNSVRISSVYGGDYSTSLAIPETINGKTVTEIGAEAFLSKHELTSVTIPATVTGHAHTRVNLK